jgi:NAD(P)-dependent dehydrogenase (short-subunit alcohol dehydrogenase family)
MIEGDITDRKTLLAARDEVAKITGGSLDYLINNAAYVSESTGHRDIGDFENDPEVLEQDLNRSFAINVIGVINTINVFLPLIKKSSIKKVTVISSGMADADLINGGVKDAVPYTISKGAVNTAVCKYNAKYKQEGILFFALSPGVVKTWSGDDEPAAVDMLRQMVPNWSGPLTPLESAAACLKVIYGFNAAEHGGAFVSHLGTKQWL